MGARDPSLTALARDIVAASGGRVTLAENASVMPLSLLGDGPMGWQP